MGAMESHIETDSAILQHHEACGGRSDSHRSRRSGRRERH